MEQLLLSYHLPFHEFRAFINEHNMLVTGLVALEGYLLQNGVECAPMKKEISVWVHHNNRHRRDVVLEAYLLRDGARILDAYRDQDSEDDSDQDSEDDSDQEWGALEWFMFFLKGHGYQSAENSRVFCQPAPFYHTHCMTHESGPTILIHKVMPTKGPFLPLLSQYNPISVTSWWDSRENVFMTTYETITRAKQVFIPRLQNTTHVSSLQHDILSYLVSCGFTVIEEPCLPLHQEDTRAILETMDPFEGYMAFDLIAYEEIGCIDHLRSSAWNVLVCVNRAFYAYDRRVLFQMMREKEFVLQGHRFVTSPHQQSISEQALTYLCTSDYSVLEWVHAYDTSERSFYDVHFYTVNQWKQRTSDRVILSPLKTHIDPRSNMENAYHTIEEMLERERTVMAQLIEQLQHRIDNAQ